jgi:hypothetical protein
MNHPTYQHQNRAELIVSCYPLQQQQVYATATYLAIAAIAAAIGSTAVAYEGQQQQAKTAKSVSEYNAKVEQTQAAQDSMEAQENAHRLRVRNSQALGSQRAAIAASGITEAGSPLEVLAYSAGQLEMQAQDEARSAEAHRQQLVSGANQTLLGGKAQEQAFTTAGYGTILSGVSSVASSYGNARYTGAIKA